MSVVMSLVIVLFNFFFTKVKGQSDYQVRNKSVGSSKTNEESKLLSCCQKRRRTNYQETAERLDKLHNAERSALLFKLEPENTVQQAVDSAVLNAIYKCHRESSWQCETVKINVYQNA